MPVGLRKILVLIGVFGHGLSGQTAFGFEDAQILPQGRSRFSAVYGRARSIDQNYNAQGQAELLTEPYRFELSSSALRKLTPELDRLVRALNATGYHYNVRERESPSRGITLTPQDPLVGDALTRGFLDLRAQAERDHFAFSYFYGLSERVSVGFGVQWINNRVSVSKAITGPNTAADIMRGFEATDPSVLGELRQIPDAVNLLSTVDEETLQGILTSRGYNRLDTTQQKGFGDTLVGARVLTYRSPMSDFITSSQFTLNIPTGALKPAQDLARVDLGSGAWEIGAGQTFNYKPLVLGQSIGLSLSLGGVYPVPYDRKLRVPTSDTDVLPGPESAKPIRVSLGPKLQTGLGARLSPLTWLSLSTLWELKGVMRDRYSAPVLETVDTQNHFFQKTLSQLKFNLSISSVSAFLAHSFVLPADLSITWTQPIAGRNQSITPHLILETALYF